MCLTGGTLAVASRHSSIDIMGRSHGGEEHRVRHGAAAKSLEGLMANSGGMKTIIFWTMVRALVRERRPSSIGRLLASCQTT